MGFTFTRNMKSNINSNHITFSVLMANYNNADFLEEAIKSVLSQTYPYWELIIVDDISTDNSIEIIKSYLKDNRIKLIIHETNMGYGGALKTAADNTSNDVLAILDSDDVLHKNALEVMASAFTSNPEFGFIYSMFWQCDSNLNHPKIVKYVGEIQPNKSNLHEIKVSHFKAFRKDAYKQTKGFDPNQKKAVDKDIIFKLEEVTKLKFVNIPLYYYRWHGGGISQEKSRFEAEFYHYLAKLKAYKRRVNTEIPNLTIKQINFEYYRITFFKLTHFLKYFYDKFRISELLDNLLNLFPLIPIGFKKKLKFLEKLK